MNENQTSDLFISMIYSLQMQAFIHLGKIINPATNKTEKDLVAAQMTIDMLDMLKDKTKGNLTDYEKSFLEKVIADLKLNYVDEVNAESKSTSSAASTEDTTNKT
ncbi:MAG: DUF1844 domain-containing protein [Ignavibacteria bacterium]